MREVPRPESSAGSHPISCHLGAGARASQPQGAFTRNTKLETKATGRPSALGGKTEQAQNELELVPTFNITVSES